MGLIKNNRSNMIYLYKNVDNILITDSVVSYIPTQLDIYIDDKLVDTYTNESTDVNYWNFTVLSGTTELYSNSEHKISYNYVGETLKEELLLIKDYKVLESDKELTKVKTDKYYERRK